jgi:uncharacterized OB-fold protein
MTEYQKPLPDPDDELTAPFWCAARRHTLVVQQCTACSYLRWPPGPLCPECQAPGGVWVEVRPTGSLWSYAVYYRALDPAFKEDVPYTVGLVELDDGPRMYGPVIGEVGTFAVDQPVRAVFEEVIPGVTLVRWELVSAEMH